MKVFVTGSSSHLASALLPQLCALPQIERVTGVDLDKSRYAHPKFHATRLDIRSPQIERLMHGHDALVHLAFVVLRARMSKAKMFDINVNGSHNAFNAARRAGVKRLIHVSSAAVYGSGIHLNESAPFRPLSGFLYAQHKADIEQLLAVDFPECVRLRPHIILGPHAQPWLKWLLRQPCYIWHPEPYPLLQCVHEDDVARAVLLAIALDVRGPFNLAVEDRFSFRDVIRRRHRASIPVPAAVARASAYLAWRLLGWGGEPAWIASLAKTLLIGCRRAHFELGWEAQHDAKSMLMEA
ncbi:MAG TPA: NAD-dependent epimerase/dehydratase family protein [Burkholderiales bacterium]|nr:NAD-dependent epimerase/dehydratase family protein [Burkholderiales bacterium]